MTLALISSKIHFDCVDISKSRPETNWAAKQIKAATRQLERQLSNTPMMIFTSEISLGRE